LLGTGVLWYFDLLEDDEEEDQAKGKEGKTAIPHVRTSEGSESDEKEDEGGEENEEDEARIPEEMPEDAIFIPFGWTRQRPTTFYKGSDPEWQSFLEFRGDRDRELAVRSRFLQLPYRKGSSV